MKEKILKALANDDNWIDAILMISILCALFFAWREITLTLSGN